MTGLTIQLTRSDSETSSGPVAVRVPNTVLDSQYGADYRSRVRWMQIPTTTAQSLAAGKRQRGATLATPVASSVTADPTSTILSPQVSHQAVYVTAASAPTSSDGTGSFAAQPIKSSATWQVSPQTGDFTWSEPIRTPPAPAGPSPDLSLAYDSQSTDGEIGTSNNQTSTVGEGWTLSGGGSISRTYTPCATNDGPGGAITGSADLCWGVDNATLTLGSTSSTLINDNGIWKLANDNHSRVQYLTGTSNGTYDGDYWKITTGDGIQYFFGMNRLPGWHTGDTETNSAWTVPVCGTATTNCSGTSTTASPFHDEAWQWNLDYVVDPHGNAEAARYTTQTNSYAQNGAGSSSYTRAGQLSEIDYGLRSDTLFSTGNAVFTSGATVASGKVAFAYDARCETGKSGEPAGACSQSSPTASYWPDVPWDQSCTTANCTQKSPTFWSSYMLSTITTSVLNGGNYTSVDTWTLGHDWPDPGDGTAAALWLTQIGHSGSASGPGIVGAAITTPTITFAGTTKQNRVWVVDGLAPMDKYRIQSITTDTGAMITVYYSGQECTPGMVTSLNSAPATNNHRCFPAWWAPQNPAQEAQLDWFHKYVVTSVVEDPRTGGPYDHPEESDYLYSDPAWRFDTAPGTPDSQRTWSDWAGYKTVEVRTGDSNYPALQHTTDYTYFRGLDGDPNGPVTTPTSSFDSETMTSSDGVKVTDARQWAGNVFEQVTRNGSSGGSGFSTTPVVADTTNVPWTSPATATSTRTYQYKDPVTSKTYNATITSNAYLTGTTSTSTTSPLSTGGTRTAITTTSYDSTYGQPGSVDVHSYDTTGGTVTGDRETCTNTTYARNTNNWLIDFPARVLETATKCSAAPNYPTNDTVTGADVVSDNATLYDNSTTIGAAPTKGEISQTQTAAGYSGSTPNWRVTSTALQYDDLGRITSATDPRTTPTNSTVTTSYTPAAGGPLTQKKVTDPSGDVSTSYLVAWASPSKIVDANGNTSTATFDALGRVSQIWLPNRAQGTYPSAPSTSYVYTLSSTALQSVAKTSINAGGGTTTSYSVYDGLGDLRQTQDPAEGGGVDVVDHAYDANRQSSIISAPYYATGNPSSSLITPTTTVPSQTQTVYDGAGRTTASILLVDNQEAWRTSTSYLGADRQDVVPPAGGTPTSTVTNPQGYTSKLTQYLSSGISGTGETTSYGYDARGDMTSMSDPAGNKWSWTFNLLGQQIADTDPDTGDATQTYWPAGTLKTSQDAVGNTLYYTYDVLGRKTAEYTGTGTSGTQLAGWTYDSATAGKGLPATSTRYVGGTAGTPASGVAYKTAVGGYTPLGDPTSTSVTIGGTTPLAGTYTTSYTYAADGNLQSQTDPAEGGLPSEKIISGFDSLGNVSGVSSPLGKIASSVQYTHLGQPAQIMQLQGAQTWRTYYWNSGTLRLDELLSQRNATANAVVSDDTYTYDNSGQILKDSNATTAAGTDAQCFSYDHQQNLQQAWTPANNDCMTNPSATTTFGGPAPYWTSYVIDPVTGNRTSTAQHTLTTGGTVSATTTATYSYPAVGAKPGSTGTGSGGPHAVASISAGTGTTGSYLYDKNGSATSIPGHTISYNSDELPTSQTVNGKTETDIYTAGGDLLLTTDPTNGSTAYLGDTQLHVAASATTVTGSRTYTACGEPLAERDTVAGTSGTQYYFLDPNPQGTVTATVTASTAAVTRRYYDPFGVPRGTGTLAATGNHVYLNAPQQLLTAGTTTTAATVQLGARQYDPAAGRFLSADPVLDPASPQQTNGYAYGNNNPVNLFDPNGLDPRQPGQCFPDDPICLGRSPKGSTCDANPCAGGTPPTVQHSGIGDIGDYDPSRGHGYTHCNSGDTKCFSTSKNKDPKQLICGMQGCFPADTQYTANAAGSCGSWACQALDAAAKSLNPIPAYVGCLAHGSVTACIEAAITTGLIVCAVFTDGLCSAAKVAEEGGEAGVAGGEAASGAADAAGGGGGRFTVDSSGTVVDATNASGKLSFPSHLIPKGMTPNAYGNQVWGVGADGAKSLIGTRGAGQLEDLGLTVGKAQQWQDFYSNVYRLNPANAAAGARVRLMQNIITTLGGP